jgi:hypothetical protein
MKIIIKKEPNGQPSITYPSNDISIEENLDFFVNDGLDYVIKDNIQYDNYFFPSAYEFDKEVGVKLNIDKAKEVQKNKWREARKKRFEKLDLDFMLSLETENIEMQKSIKQKKQDLRDITKTFLTDDLEEIKATWPNILLEE